MGNNPTPQRAKRSAPTFTKISHQEGVPFIVGPSNNPNAHRTRIIVLSDTHRKHRDFGKLPDGDVLVHCGDWSNWASCKNDTEDFNAWLKDQPHALKIVVAGNHEINLSSGTAKKNQSIVSNAVYLQGQEFIANGIKFWGGPWNPARGFTKRANGFSVSSEECARNWSRMPEDVDILITHCPPYGVLDRKDKNQTISYMGCPQLLDNIIRVTPTVHMFGHCHYESGIANAKIDVRDVFASRLQRRNSFNSNLQKNNNSNNLNINNNNNSINNSNSSNNTKDADQSTTVNNQGGNNGVSSTTMQKPSSNVNEENEDSDMKNNSENKKVWSCKACTFINQDDSFLSCEACGTERTFEMENVNRNVVFVNAANKFRMFPTIIDFYKVRE